MSRTVSRISFTWLEDIVSKPESGEFYWRMRPFVSRKDYTSDDLAKPVVKKMQEELNKLKAKRGY